MNPLESEYAFMLDVRRRLSEILDWGYETDKLILGPKCTYTPDFRIRECDCSVTFVEVKGRKMHDDSIVKLKWAATVHPIYSLSLGSAVIHVPCRFVLARKLNGRWTHKTIPPGIEDR